MTMLLFSVSNSSSVAWPILLLLRNQNNKGENLCQLSQALREWQGITNIM